MIYLAAFFGGMLLNLMPCVLPVLGLKLSKPSPHFVLGMLSVFAALATLSTALDVTWGAQFNYPWFNVAMAGIVFALALSLFGLWEIPARYSGRVSGPFAKGVLSTLLATPCSGPLLGAVFAFTLGKPAWVVYSVFLTVGLGMSTPYILAMVVRVPLPKPGPWMEHLKAAFGFMLMGTVIWLLTAVAERLLFPTLVMLLLIGVVCWARRWWLVPIIALPFLVFQTEETLPWRPYSHAAFVEYEFDGTPMLIDFTAQLCLTCKTNEALVLNTAAVKRAVEREGFVALVADVANPECAEKLQEFGYNSVPVVVVVKAGKVTILPDLISKKQLLDAIEG